MHRQNSLRTSPLLFMLSALYTNDCSFTYFSPASFKALRSLEAGGECVLGFLLFLYTVIKNILIIGHDFAPSNPNLAVRDFVKLSGTGCR